ncbi:ParB-like protein [Enterobacter adelaidei]
MKKLGSLLMFLMASPALAISPCSTQSDVGSRCEVNIDALRPTQPFVGQLQVEANQAKLASKNSRQLDEYLDKKPIPVVISPGGNFWLIDRHHLTKALWQLGIKKVPVTVIAHLKQKDSFWQQMTENHWVWLKNEKGLEITPQQLPRHVGDLPDYPYRTLAGELQDAGYYEKNKQVYFVEFAWANWLGEQMKWVNVDASNLNERLKQAEILACSPEAKGLPGYPGKKCSSLE